MLCVHAPRTWGCKSAWLRRPHRCAGVLRVFRNLLMTLWQRDYAARSLWKRQTPHLQRSCLKMVRCGVPTTVWEGVGRG